ncbi:MAG: hypothetical protein R6V25_03195 [Desulfatiglandales bacterium]
MVFFANLGVNLRGCLCGVLQYASAQPLDFLDLDKKSSFLNWKLANARKAFLDGHYITCRTPETFAAASLRFRPERRPEWGWMTGGGPIRWRRPLKRGNRP